MGQMNTKALGGVSGCGGGRWGVGRTGMGVIVRIHQEGGKLEQPRV